MSEFPGHISLQIDERGIITVEGVKISLWAIHNGLHNPPSDCLFSIKREGDALTFTRYNSAEAAAQFFKGAE